MATITRRWYIYNCANGGQLNHTNYYYISTFPNICAVSATDICAILGIYSIIEEATGHEQFFRINPQSFTQDTAIFAYITFATGNTPYVPGGTGQKPYVYKRFCPTSQ